MNIFEKFFSKKEEEAIVVNPVVSLNRMPMPVNSIDSLLYADYEKAMAEVEAAKNRFELVAPGYEDVAILELTAAEARYDAVLKEIRATAHKSN